MTPSDLYGTAGGVGRPMGASPLHRISQDGRRAGGGRRPGGGRSGDSAAGSRSSGAGGTPCLPSAPGLLMLCRCALWLVPVCVWGGGGAMTA